jgi:transcriptional regulator with GAF, ATPase, and Fis domain
VKFRLITATNRDLRKEVTDGRFRMDLYYRVAVTSIRIPPLRDRLADIPLLSQALLEKLALHHGVQVPQLTASELNDLCFVFVAGQCTGTAQHTRIDAADGRASAQP